MDSPADPPTIEAGVTEPPQAHVPDRFLVPPTLYTPHVWTDTTAVSSDTFTKGVWARNADGAWAFRKPGVTKAGSLEAVREVVCSVIAHWLHVPSPTQELLLHEKHGPCSISYDLPDGQTYRWFNVMVMQLSPNLYAEGTIALQAYAGPVIILDALVGGIDRTNFGNHLYVESERRWYAIDYGLSFNRFPNPASGDDGRSGTGDPRIGFGTLQGVFPEILNALRLNEGAFRDTLALAESIPDDRFEALLGMIPAEFADAKDTAEMVAFLKYRRSNLRTLLQNWCQNNGMTGLLK